MRPYAHDVALILIIAYPALATLLALLVGLAAARLHHQVHASCELRVLTSSPNPREAFVVRFLSLTLSLNIVRLTQNALGKNIFSDPKVNFQTHVLVLKSCQKRLFFYMISGRVHVS